jgi:3-oxoadipate enol-lactonase/4-carboxymuconolactone decarboxylase
MVADVAALWDALGIERTALLGISMGGFIAQRLVLAHPERVRCLVLVSTGAAQQALTKDDAPWQADLGAVQKKLSTYFTPQFAARNATLVTSMAKQIAKAVEAGGFAERAEAQRRALAGFDNSAHLGGIRAPTLVIHGTEDAIIAVSAADALAAGVPNAKKALLPGAGHLLLAEKPRELYDLVSNFLAST